MRKLISFLLFVFLSASLSTAYSSPFDLSTKKQYDEVPQFENFRYWYGDIQYGFITYLGLSDVSGFETELHLHFAGKKPTRMTLILGPGGLTEDSCISDYKAVVKLLNQKYGNYQNQNVTKDPLIDDLIAVSVCVPVRTELYTIDTYWRTKGRTIVASLIGDGEGYYIEIDHIFSRSLSHPLKKLKNTL
jgi:hypothetical protein